MPSKEDVLADRYRLEARLGGGGMGDVWRARSLVDGRDVAIKILRTLHTGDPVLVTRFLREARAARMVRHPNVVEVLDVGQTGEGAPFIVEELLIGDDLSATLKSIGGTLRADIAIDLMLPIAEAVAGVHESGIVHRDLKPGNIFLARVGKKTIPKLLDFGISQLSDTSDASRITTTGVALGTPAYMAPEQVMAQKDLDARVDVWALGVILYEMVAGKLPFQKGDTPGALYVQICTSNPPPLREFAADVPEAYERIVARCMQRERTERYASARELANDLAAARAGRTLRPTTRPLPPVVFSSEKLELVASHEDDETIELAVGPVEKHASRRIALLGGDSPRALRPPEARERKGNPPARALDVVVALLGAALTAGAWATAAPRGAVAVSALILAGLTGWRAVGGGRVSMGLLLLAASCVALALAASVATWLAGDFPSLPGAIVPWIALVGPACAAVAALRELVVAARSSRPGIVALAALVVVTSLAMTVLGLVARSRVG